MYRIHRIIIYLIVIVGLILILLDKVKELLVKIIDIARVIVGT